MELRNHSLVVLFRALNYLRPIHCGIEECKVQDDSMYPTYRKNQVVEIDQHKPAMHGDIVAIASENGVEFRELFVCMGIHYLVAHNHAYPKVALSDYRALNPDAYYLGIAR
jgi:hypothetical protein